MAIEIIGRKPSHVKHYRIECSNTKCDAVLKFARDDMFNIANTCLAIRCLKCDQKILIAEFGMVEKILAKLEYEEPSQK